ncbi:cytochrome c-type biogenesis protein [Hyphobacterium sp. HN65]|uniref:Cytochrome c-type biogenesis protein n=1 Tax=Hyphobacterium lacteum TaxID=3116575 RepID=A0ABU7LT15_9PROT|nr:cytochrome c-type biogenesis protein [Hyphobacterium sp. HN65]MEE2527067.1 cytochrome c-type biogenesis protein [Hyphobacterium sp. HN65]
MIKLLLASLLLQGAQLSPQQEREAAELMREIRCVVCEGQSIADSDAALAQDMRAFVRNQIGAGADPDSVRIALAQTYGDEVLMRPRLNAQTLPLYLAPLLLLLAGAGLIGLASRKR